MSGPPESLTRLVALRDGANIWTAMSGTGPPVAFCPGGPGLCDCLAPLASLVDDSVTAIRFGQRGCGRSTGPGPSSIAHADMDRIRETFGHPMGSGRSLVGAELALRYAASHPERTTAVLYTAVSNSEDASNPALLKISGIQALRPT